MGEKAMTAYKHVYNQIKRAIETGKFSVGSLLPSEQALGELYGVSRITVRKAVELLSNEGLVTVKQGYGTTVMDPNTVQKLNYVTSFSETLLANGYDLSTMECHVDVLASSEKVAGPLGLEPGAPVMRIQRLMAANGKPIALMTNYLSADLPFDGDAFTKNPQPLYQFLEKNCGLPIDAASDVITARACDLAQAHLLQLPVGSSLIYLKRTTYEKGRPITFDCCYIDGMRYSFSVNLVGRKQ
jgi:GntR family transcriptional regulator